MAKAIEAFSGIDSQCRRVQAAIREDGQWFSRVLCYNSYGLGWTRWTKTEALPRRDENRVEWGFKTIDRVSPKGLRLPS